MFDIGWSELLVIGVVALAGLVKKLFFGKKQESVELAETPSAPTDGPAAS